MNMTDKSPLPLRARKAVQRTMKGVLRYAAGRQIVLNDMDPAEGVGRSFIDKLVAYVEIAFGFLFPSDMSDAEKETVLYGVGVHEILHVLRTDFDYAARKMEKFPPSERTARHMFANVVEDAAIEYLRSDRLSDFMNDALTASIGYFYKDGPNLGEQDSAWAELVTALIQFGDVGVLKGNFKFPEAEKAFVACVGKYQDAIVEPTFARRFEASQEMFEECRPVWEAFVQEQLLVEKTLKDLMTALGKDLFSAKRGKGQPLDDGTSASAGSNSSAANERRKKTIHLIDEKQAEELQKRSEENGTETDDPSEATDIYVVVGDKTESDESNDGNGSSVPVPSENADSADSEAGTNDDFDVVDEREVKPKSEKDAQDESNGNSESEASGKSGKPDDSRTLGGSAKSEAKGDGKPNSDESSPKGSDSASEAGDVDLDSEKEKILDGVSGKPNETKDVLSESSKASEGDLDATGSSTISDPVGADDSTSPKDLGEELKELSRELSEALKESGELEVSEDLLAQMEASVESELKRESLRNQNETKKTQAEAIDVTVESPYYTDVKYVNVEVTNPNGREYASIASEESVKRTTLNLKAAFKKIFQFKSGKKEYRANGRIDLERYSGKKVTARMFYRKSAPDDKSDMAMVIFVDQSGSMGMSVQRVKQTLVVLLDALRDFDVKVKVVGFTTHGEVTYYHYGNRQWKNDPALVRTCMNMNASGGTFLGHALRYTGAMLKNRPESHKMYVCITDGDPSYYLYENRSQGLNDCRQAVNEVRKYADVIGIGVYSDEEEEAAFRYVFRDACVSMNTLDGLSKELPRRMKKILSKG